MDNLLFLQYLQHTDKKTRTIRPRRNPFEEYHEEEFKMFSITPLYFATKSASNTFSDDVILQHRWRFFLSI